jgi:hypothetical protein
MDGADNVLALGVVNGGVGIILVEPLIANPLIVPSKLTCSKRLH